jgi:hypothetical protein
MGFFFRRESLCLDTTPGPNEMFLKPPKFLQTACSNRGVSVHVSRMSSKGWMLEVTGGVRCCLYFWSVTVKIFISRWVAAAAAAVLCVQALVCRDCLTSCAVFVSVCSLSLLSLTYYCRSHAFLQLHQTPRWQHLKITAAFEDGPKPRTVNQGFQVLICALVQLEYY